MSLPDLVLVSMIVVAPVSLVLAIVVSSTSRRVPRTGRIALVVLGALAVLGVLTWLVLRLSAFGYWMSGNGPEPTRVAVASVIGTTAAALGWVALVCSVVVAVVERRRRRSV